MRGSGQLVLVLLWRASSPVKCVQRTGRSTQAGSWRKRQQLGMMAQAPRGSCWTSRVTAPQRRQQWLRQLRRRRGRTRSRSGLLAMKRYLTAVRQELVWRQQRRSTSQGTMRLLRQACRLRTHTTRLLAWAHRQNASLGRQRLGRRLSAPRQLRLPSSDQRSEAQETQALLLPLLLRLEMLHSQIHRQQAPVTSAKQQPTLRPPCSLFCSPPPPRQLWRSKRQRHPTRAAPQPKPSLSFD